MKLHSTLPVSLTLYPKVPVDFNAVLSWCYANLGEVEVDWEVWGSPYTMTNVLWCAFKEESSATMFALRWA